jgi:choline-sulfatase
MNRRRFFLTAGAGVLAARSVVRGATPPARPNILFILSDQFRGDALGADGNTFVHTPNLDRLASESVRFTHAYTAQALCTPARATLITGLYPHTHRLQGNVYKVPNALADPQYRLAVNFPTLLKQAGYTTGWVGKWHLGEENPGCFDHWNGFNSLLPHWLGEQQKSPYRSDVETDDGLRFLEENRSRPFLLCQSYYPPHTPYTAPERFYRLFEGKNVDHMQYYAATAAVDWNIGRLLEGLKKLGLAQNTVVIFTADHGETFGQRPFSSNKTVCYEESARVPLLIRHPNLKPAVWRSGVNNIDVMPTILDAAGLPIPSGVQGKSLLERIRSGRDRWDQPVILENITQRMAGGKKGEGGNQPIERAVRTERWKLILRTFSEEPERRMDELYDLAQDPGEKQDLLARPEAAPRVKELSKMLLAWGRRYADEVAVRLASRYA